MSQPQQATLLEEAACECYGTVERQYAGLEGRRVLVAEDQVIVALDLAENLRGWGCTVLGPVASTTEGLEPLRHERPDAALLDAKLADGWVTPLAEALAAAGVPFALLTGCDGPALDDLALRAAPRLPKPYTSAALRRVLSGLLVVAPTPCIPWPPPTSRRTRADRRPSRCLKRMPWRRVRAGDRPRRGGRHPATLSEMK